MRHLVLGAILAASIATPALADWHDHGRGGYRGGYYGRPGYYVRPGYAYGYGRPYAYGYGRPYYVRPYYGYAAPYYAPPPPVYYTPPVVVAPAPVYGGYGGVAYPAYGGGYPQGYAYRCGSSGGGAVLGAIAGGLIGNAAGNHYNRGATTVVGAGVGAVTGDAIERSGHC